MKKYDFLTSPVGRTLLFKSLPVFLSIFAQIAYNLADTFFVAKLGTAELAAISFSFPVVMVAINLIIGIAAGISSVVSQSIGAHDQIAASHYSKKGLELTVLLSLIITIVGFGTIEPLFKLLGVGSIHVMSLTKDYMYTWYLGVIFMNLSMVGSALFRAKGQVLFPSLMVIAGAALNALLDPILIYGWGPIPSMGVKGAALTTVMGNAFSTFILFYKFYKDENITIPLIPKICLKSYREILRIALPTALANSLTPISTAITNRMLVVYGVAAVAANSVATRLETVPFIAIFALASVLSPFIGQNWGANNLSRLKEGIKKSFIFSYLLGVVFAILYIWQSKNLALLFDSNPQVVDVTISYFSIVPYTYGLLGTVFLIVQSMNAVGKPYFGNFLSALRLIFLYLPMAYFLNQLYELEGIFQSRFIANTITGLLALVLAYRTFFKAAKAKTIEIPLQ